jgi:hypothetical protein
MTLTWRSLILAALAGGLCGCTQSSPTNTTTVAPESVAPAPVNHLAYMGFSCEKLAQNQAYIAQEFQQVKPGENATANVAHLKGESEAVKKAMGLKRCPQTAEAKKTP